MSSEFPIVGNYYRNQREVDFYKLLCIDDLLVLEFDPTNKFDTHAIKISSWNLKYHLGFVDRVSAKNIDSIVSDIHKDNSVIFDKKRLFITAVVISEPISGRVMFKIRDFKFLNEVI